MSSQDDEVDDYMSLSFVVEDNTSKVANKKKNVPTDNKNQRKRQRRFTQQEQMDSSLKEGLSKPIDASNKGFKLLEKFGFKKEEGGLGKFGTGIQEPIQVHAQLGKSSNFGIGKEKSIQEIHKRFQNKLLQHQESMISLEVGFRQSMKHVQECKQLCRDVMQAEKIIEHLDQREVIERHALWPRLERDEDEVGEHCSGGDDGGGEVGTTGTVHQDTGDEVSIIDGVDDFPTLLLKLETRLVYLRATHTYCLYCGCSFEDFEDMTSNCDGPLRDDH